MSVIAPATTGTVKKTIRFPDALIREMDRYAKYTYTNRPDFVLAAMRQFAYDTIMMIDDAIYETDRNATIESRLAAVELQRAQNVNPYLKDLAGYMDDSEDVTQVMLYIPEGLIDEVEFIIGFIHTLKNITVFARVAVIYAMNAMDYHKDMLKHIMAFDNLRLEMNRNRYLKEIRSQYKESGVFLLDIEEDPKKENRMKLFGRRHD